MAAGEMKRIREALGKRWYHDTVGTVADCVERVMRRFAELERELARAQRQGEKANSIAMERFHAIEARDATIREQAAEIERLKADANAFVEVAEAHRLELIVEDYVTESTKAEYAAARERLGLTTGAIDPESLKDARDDTREG